MILSKQNQKMALKREYNKDINYYIIIINKAREPKKKKEQNNILQNKNLLGLETCLANQLNPTLLTCMANQLNSTQLKLCFPLWPLKKCKKQRI